MPLPRPDHLLGKENQENRDDLEDLLQRAALFLRTPVNSPQKPSRRKAAPVRMLERLSPRAS